MTKTRITLAAGLLAIGALALPAQAGEPRTGTLVCGATTYTVSGNLYGNGYKLTRTGRPQNFIVTYLRTPNGTELVKRSPGKQRLGTLSCTYTVTGTSGTAVVEGFLTPAR